MDMLTQFGIAAAIGVVILTVFALVAKRAMNAEPSPPSDLPPAGSPAPPESGPVDRPEEDKIRIDPPNPDVPPHEGEIDFSREEDFDYDPDRAQAADTNAGTSELAVDVGEIEVPQDLEGLPRSGSLEKDNRIESASDVLALALNNELQSVNGIGPDYARRIRNALNVLNSDEQSGDSSQDSSLQSDLE